IPAQFRPRLMNSTALARDNTPPPTALIGYVSNKAVSQLFGRADSLKAGTAGKAITGTVVTHRAQAPGRNVVAILPGSDPVLKNQYVAIGAHNDHIGFNNRPVDHNSIRAFNMVARPQGADSPPVQKPSDEQVARIRAITDSLHALHGVRKDSIFN